MARVNIEIPDDMHRKVKVDCALRGVTLIEFINKAVEEKLKK